MEVNLIAGPPGTGKTTTLMDIIEKELLVPLELHFQCDDRKYNVAEKSSLGEQ